MQIFLRTSIIPHNRGFNFPAQFVSNSKSSSDIVLLYPTRKPTNLEERYLIQVTESLILTSLEIDLFCAVQEI